MFALLINKRFEIMQTYSYRKFGFLASLLLIPSLAISAPKFEQMWETSGFAQPESIIADQKGEHLFVSNIQGHPLEADGKGYISQLTLDGKIIKKEWATGLDAPKGMAVANHRLYVADLTKVRVYSVETAKLLNTYHVPEAGLLNDVSSDAQGNVYISDMIKGNIYRIHKGDIAPWYENKHIGHPNGLQVVNNTLIVGDWGHNMQADFSTEQLGSLYEIDLSNQTTNRIAGSEELGNLDGVVLVGDSIITNNWITGEVYLVKQGQVQKLANLPAGTADINNLGNIILVPLMFNDVVRAYRYQP